MHYQKSPHLHKWFLCYTYRRQRENYFPFQNDENYVFFAVVLMLMSTAWVGGMDTQKCSAKLNSTIAVVIFVILRITNSYLRRVRLYL